MTITASGRSETVDYQFDGKNLTFRYSYEDCTGTYEDGKLTCSDETSEMFGQDREFTKQSEEEKLDAFAGTWKFDSTIVVFDGKGKVSYNEHEYSYTINGEGKAVFNDGVHDVTCTLQNDTTIDMYFDDGYGEDVFHKTATKQ